MELAVAALLGLIIGSFLNVCILRLPKGESIVLPPSACPRCHHEIAFYDNIPLISFLILRGKCRHCKAPISWQYPLVEAGNALLWLSVCLAFGFQPQSLLYAALTSALLTLAIIDGRERLLPHEITFGGLALGLGTAPLQLLHNQEQAQSMTHALAGLLGANLNSPVILSYISSLLGALFGAGMLGIVAAGYYVVTRKQGMGHGDIIMMAFVGSFLGWPMTLLTIFLGAFLGALIGSILIWRAGGDTQYEIPFGTFLAAAAILSLFFGQEILTWYWNLGRA